MPVVDGQLECGEGCGGKAFVLPGKPFKEVFHARVVGEEQGSSGGPGIGKRFQEYRCAGVVELGEKPHLTGKAGGLGEEVEGFPGASAV